MLRRNLGKVVLILVLCAKYFKRTAKMNLQLTAHIFFSSTNFTHCFAMSFVCLLSIVLCLFARVVLFLLRILDDHKSLQLHEILRNFLDEQDNFIPSFLKQMLEQHKENNTCSLRSLSSIFDWIWESEPFFHTNNFLSISCLLTSGV